MGRRRRRVALALVGLLGFGALATSGAPRALATDLDALRERAQRIADSVTELERELEALRARRARLQRAIVEHTQRIALLERAMQVARRHADEARRRYIERAVEAYKEGPTADLELVLSARSFAEVLDAAEAASNAAEEDRGALRDLEEVLAAQEETQRAI